MKPFISHLFLTTVLVSMYWYNLYCRMVGGGTESKKPGATTQRKQTRHQIAASAPKARVRADQRTRLVRLT